MTGGAPPPPVVITMMENIGFDVSHLCSLTEIHGPGVEMKDPIKMENVEWDGTSIGEIMFRGNTDMSGYLKDLKATKEAFLDGWRQSGNLVVKHTDGYIEFKDRSKDIIISGGKNISSIEVKTAIYSHPAVLEVALVARLINIWVNHRVHLFVSFGMKMLNYQLASMINDR
ncbi:AMP-dependent synthetase and ligase family protein [Artemisia annua]|uniref:AMP-dependent synthetase and ligase family protein n=1 Tax=Artemisia annua TaxID=35608 RepID=A0A2U1L9K8_ARTAN|nr:AMP-dependent synthetase and ligase family protein [Artemisia annua]